MVTDRYIGPKSCYWLLFTRVMQPLSLDYVSTYVPFCLFPYIFLHFT